MVLSSLYYRNSDNPILCHKIIVTSSAFNATYDAGFFLVPMDLNESKIWVTLQTKYQGVSVGVGPRRRDIIHHT